MDGSGTIEEDEWVTYFKVVKGAGHTDEEILREVENQDIFNIILIFILKLQKFENAVAWVQFDKVSADRRKNK